MMSIRSAITTLSASIITIVLMSPALQAHQHEKKENKEETSEKLSLVSNEIAENLFMISGQGGFTGGNVVLVVGKQHAVLIDDKIAKMEKPLIDIVQSITDRPISFLVNTHLHNDHTGNNAAIAKQHTHIVGHSNVRKRMQKDTKTYSEEALPKLTYLDSMALYVADQPAILIHAPKAHTDGDSFVVFKESNVIHAADLFFNELFPFIDLSSGGSVQGYLAGQKRILMISNDETIIVPGHGKLGNKKELQTMHDMLVDAVDIVKTAKEKGISLAKLKEDKVLEKYKSYSWGFVSSEKMIEQLFNDTSI